MGVDLSIRSVETASAVSGTPFQPGDRVWSYLYRNPEGLIERFDCLEGEREGVSLEGGILCSWGHVKKARQISEAEERKAALRSTEDVFLSLYEEPGEGGTEASGLEESRDRLKFFLALQLERKRVLRHMGGTRYRHISTKRDYPVPQLEITPELLAAFREEIALMGGPA